MTKFQLKTQSIYCGDNLTILKDIPDRVTVRQRPLRRNLRLLAPLGVEGRISYQPQV